MSGPWRTELSGSSTEIRVAGESQAALMVKVGIRGLGPNKTLWDYRLVGILPAEFTKLVRHADRHVYIQVGAGAGDLDTRSAKPDGFSQLVKGLALGPQDRVVLIEPNPRNLEALRQSWQCLAETTFVVSGVIPDGEESRSLTFWYADEDAPHFQVCSLSREHVQRHYPQATLKNFEAPCQPISILLDEHRQGDEISLLALDVEGLDAEVLLSIDWRNLPCCSVSFESLHLGEYSEAVARALTQAGFVAAGDGLDSEGYDRFFVRPKSLVGRARCLLRERRRRRIAT